MQQQNLQIDSAGNVWDMSSGKPVFVHGPQQSIQTKPADQALPYKVRQERNQAAASQYAPQTAQADATIKTADAGVADTVAKAQAQKAVADAIAAQAQAQTAQAGGPRIDASVRQKAIQQYNYAKQLNDVADHLNELYLRGPGATSGIAGLKDFLPSQANKNFDAEANKSRGIVGQTLGFTGGQLNTPQEAEKAVGPYIPESANFDSTILQKIQSMRDLAKSGQDNAIQTLGGIPDANGVVHPAQPQAAQPPVTPPSNDPTTFATGKTRSIVDPVMQATGHKVGTMIAQGLPDAQIIAFLKQSGVTPADTSISQALQFRKTDDYKRWQRSHPGQSYPISPEFYTKQVPMTDTRALLNKTAASGIGGAALAAPVAAANAMTGGYLNDLTANPQATQTGMDLLRGQHPLSSLAGDVAGQATDEALLGLIPGGRALMATKLGRRGADLGYGAFSGSGEGDGNRGVGAAEGAGLGLAGGMFGRGAQRAFGGLFTGVTNPALQLLDNSGVPLTIGQIGQGSNSTVGHIIGGIEDRLAGLPGSDAVINNARRRGLQGFNSAAFKKAGGSGATGAAGLEEMAKLRSGAYNFLNGTDIPLDAQFAGSQAGIRASIPDMPAYGNEVGKGLDQIDRVSKGGSMSGLDWQDALSDTKGNRVSITGQPFARNAAKGLRQVEDNLQQLAARQGPQGTLDALNAANKLHGQTETLLSALDNGPTQKADQLFTPGRLDDASRANARKFGGRLASLTGANRPFYDLTQAGNQVLPQVVKDSGTAGRMMLVPMMTGALGSSIGAGANSNDRLGGSAEGAKYGALVGLMAGGPYSKTGQKALQKLLLADRPETLQRIGQYIINHNAKYSGMFGASMLRDYFMQPELGQ